MSTITPLIPTATTQITTHNQYLSTGIPNKESLHPDPLLQFNDWFASANLNKAVNEPEAFALSTVSTSGIPSTRVLLLKQVDKKGFVFYTNYASRKGGELFKDGYLGDGREGGYASMAFYWREQHRSVRVVGKVEKVSERETKDYYEGRPVGSRIGAWASAQSTVLSGREELEAQVTAIEKKFGVTDLKEGEDKEIPVPPFWGGVRIIPFEIEFWMGRESRLHDRFRYTREEGVTEGGWTIDRLSP